MTRLLVLAVLLVPGLAAAQTPSTSPAGAVEFTAGYAGFVDDALMGHSVVGGSGRLYVGSLFSVGPEIVYMGGPRGHHDLFVTGNLTIDLRGNRGGGARLIPFAVVGGGLMRTSDRFLTGTFVSYDPAFTAGVGLRGHVTDRVFVGGDVRLGWELHMRATGIVGVRFGS